MRDPTSHAEAVRQQDRDRVLRELATEGRTVLVLTRDERDVVARTLEIALDEFGVADDRVANDTRLRDVLDRLTRPVRRSP